MKPVMYFLMSSIGLVRGGITQASLKQASLFAEMGYKTNILTFDFNPDYPLIRSELLRMNKIHKNVKIINLYEDLEGSKVINKPIKKASLSQLTSGLPYKERSGTNAFRVYKNGVYDKYISLNSNGSLEFIDYFNENRHRTRREVYDPWGNLKQVKYMDFYTNKPRQTVFYNTKGKAFLSQWNNPESGKVKRNLLFENKTTIKEYENDNVSLRTDWISKLIDKPSIIISDTRTTDNILLKVENNNAAKVWRLHSNHLGNPYNEHADIAPKVKVGFNNIDEYDVAVFLTNEQKNDISTLIGDKTIYKVVPHYHDAHSGTELIKSIKRPKKDEKLAVIVSRFSTLKRIDHSIRAFSSVVNRIPDARLEIWGTGKQKDKLRKLVSELGLENNVFFKGYTYDSDKVFQKGLFNLFTSKSEGFGLSCLESMGNGCPVISYDFKYGPSDMIVNNENGFLIENGDINELSAKMIYLFNNPSKAIEMGNKAKKYVAKNFNKTKYKESWLDVIDTIIKTKFQ